MTEPGYAGVVTPAPGIDPRTALATSMHAAPGVYAVLLGSGLSRSAGIPTGWEVVQDLIRRIARAEGVPEDEVDDSPAAWWERTRSTEPRYDTLLEELAPTDAIRQALLRGYFDPAPGTDGPKLPSPAHHALAALCASGHIRVFLTTNFDRLLERALEEAGVAPQVLASEDALAGMTPLAHAAATVIKLHGDYTMLGMRNTPEELSEYPGRTRQLLDRVLDEYGLLVAGWSAEHDRALVSAIAACPSRRYPIFWTSLQRAIAEPARRLINQRRAASIDTNGADEFFPDLMERLRRLDRRAKRPGRPTPLRIHTLTPERPAPQGWTASPLLQLRAVSFVGPATVDASGFIGPNQRDRLRDILEKAAVTLRLSSLSSAVAEASSPQDAGTADPNARRPLDTWNPAPGAHQSLDDASFRLGGDATSAVSALASIHLPRPGPQGPSVVIVLDVGLTLDKTMRLTDAALLLRDGLVLTSALIPGALDDILPPEADVSTVELHLSAGSTLASNGDRLHRRLQERLDLSALGDPTRELGATMSFAARVSSGLSDAEATALVVDAIEHMALANGFLDPRAGLAALRDGLGLDPVS